LHSSNTTPKNSHYARQHAVKQICPQQTPKASLIVH